MKDINLPLGFKVLKASRFDGKFIQAFDKMKQFDNIGTEKDATEGSTRFKDFVLEGYLKKKP